MDKQSSNETLSVARLHKRSFSKGPSLFQLKNECPRCFNTNVTISSRVSNIKGEVISFTGDDGIKIKSFQMNSFCREYTEEELALHDEAALGLVDYSDVHENQEDNPRVTNK